MSRYLQHIEVERFGALRDRRIGPFAPGLNVVYGPNEAGKTTVASLVGGVLFGWEEARGVRNTYRSDQGDRAGSLEWADGAADGAGDAGEGGGPLAVPTASATLSRGGKDGALQGDRTLVADIDRGTYQTMFSLTSDELLGLRDTPDVASRLLAAGSGTGFSPAGAYVEIEQRIAAHTSPLSDAEHSVVRLGQLLEEKQAQIRQETEQVELYKQEDRELRELSLNRADASTRMEALNRDLERLAAARADLATVDERIAARQEERAELSRETAEIAAGAGDADAFDERLLSLDAAAERALRDQIDELAEAREKASRIVDAAKENSATSTAAYEALVELDQDAGSGGSAGERSRTTQAVVSIVPTLVFVGAGIPLFVHGRQINSLSFTALGVGLIALACLLAVATVVFLFRPSREGDALADRRKDAQWVMLQDSKRLDSSQQEAARLDAEIADFLDGAGLAAANGSLRQARSLLDDARDARARLAAEGQRAAALDLRMKALADELTALVDERSRITREAGLPEGAGMREIDEQLRAKSEQRDALLEVADGMSMRYGELSRVLDQAKDDRTLDSLKLEYQQIRARLRDAKHELVELLLARRMLERSMAAWESRNQPEVYAEASRLFALITDGAWTEVSVSASGSVVAKSAQGDIRKPRHLSLGTCQQLYLALRIALLVSAENVGRAVPVIADDILVNFDAVRRRGAARALAELATHRQVIVFTCHEETVEALRDASRNVNYLEL